MDFNILKNIALLFAFAVLGLFLTACTKQGIKVYRESKAQRAIDEMKHVNEAQKDTVRKSSGIIIYKDNSYQNNSINQKSVNFGPKDPSFDVKVRF